jgi:hypothetical protein
MNDRPSMPGAQDWPVLTFAVCQESGHHARLVGVVPAGIGKGCGSENWAECQSHESRSCSREWSNKSCGCDHVVPSGALNQSCYTVVEY